ncbi:hypothetical protein ACVWXN_005227 [Bradyrhizobium sp. i1.4.4]
MKNEHVGAPSSASLIRRLGIDALRGADRDEVRAVEIALRDAADMIARELRIEACCLMTGTISRNAFVLQPQGTVTPPRGAVLAPASAIARASNFPGS